MTSSSSATGAEGSSVLDCPEVESALKHSSDFLGEKSFAAYGDAFRACADRLQASGVDLDGYTLTQRVDDLEAAREAPSSAAWLGFNAGEGLVALITTIVGAAVGGNLLLLALDIAWDRQVRDRSVESSAKETLQARPSTG
jgi:hypothetical protein